MSTKTDHLSRAPADTAEVEEADGRRETIACFAETVDGSYGQRWCVLTYLP